MGLGVCLTCGTLPGHIIFDLSRGKEGRSSSMLDSSPHEPILGVLSMIFALLEQTSLFQVRIQVELVPL